MGAETPKKSGPKRYRVLIADDSAAIRLSLSALISRLNNVEIVGLAGTGAEALELIRKLKPNVVTLDIRMPELNGMKVLEEIQHEGLDVMPIMLTGMADDEYRNKCLKLGARYFFHKTTEFEKVLEVLTDEPEAPKRNRRPKTACLI